MVTDTSDWQAKVRDLERRVRYLESGIQLENSSITDGRMRFIGGTLRVDSGGRVEIVGFLQVEGTTNIVGPVTIAGDLDITGNTTVAGDFQVVSGGQVRVGGVTLTPVGGGKIQIGPNIVLDAATQTISIGDGITITADGSGRIEVGSGVDVVSLDGSYETPRINLGPAQISSATGEAITFTMGTNVVYFVDNSIRIPSMPEEVAGPDLDYVGVDSLGNFKRIIGGSGGGSGGPGDGIFAWPFPLSAVTSEYGPRTYPYDGFHEGIDFGNPPATAGATIKSMGSGTVVNVLAEGQGHGWGNGVIIDHGADPLSGGANVKTLYAHMATPPLVGVGDAVTLGQALGPVGNTGGSFGAHLHLEVWLDGAHTNPRTFMSAHGG